MSREIKIQHAELSGFDVIYQNSLKPELLKHETERDTRFRIGIITAILIGILLIYPTWYLAFEAKNPDTRALNLMIAGPPLGYYAVMFGLRKRIKTKILQSVAGHLGWIHFKSKRKQSKKFAKLLRKFGLVQKYDHVKSGDTFMGTHEQTRFVFCELILSKMEGWGKNRRAVPVFEGCVLSFQLPVHTPEATLISRYPEANSGDFKFHGSYLDSLGPVYVYSNNQNAYNTVLCNRFKDAITELNKTFERLNLSCLIYDNWLHIPVTSKDRFELDWLMVSFEHPQRVQKIIDEFEDVLHLLDIILRRRYCPRTNVTARPKFTY